MIKIAIKSQLVVGLVVKLSRSETFHLESRIFTSKSLDFNIATLIYLSQIHLAKSCFRKEYL